MFMEKSSELDITLTRASFGSPAVCSWFMGQSSPTVRVDVIMEDADAYTPEKR